MSLCFHLSKVLQKHLMMKEHIIKLFFKVIIDSISTAQTFGVSTFQDGLHNE